MYDAGRRLAKRVQGLWKKIKGLKMVKLKHNLPGISRVLLGLLIAGLYFLASNMAYNDCINLGIC